MSHACDAPTTMSFTTVSESETQRTRRILLTTPSKRQRGVSNNETSESSIEEIWKWTMTPEAVAACFARDVFDMRENLEGGEIFD